MSYKGYDKWEVGSSELSDQSSTIKGLKEIIKSHIKSFYITKAETSINIEDYEITKVSVVIKKKEALCQ
jgi:hypothetical protein